MKKREDEGREDKTAAAQASDRQAVIYCPPADSQVVVSITN